MAKKSMIARELKREKMVQRFAAKRAELKTIIYSPKSTPEQIDEAVLVIRARHHLDQQSAECPWRTGQIP